MSPESDSAWQRISSREEFDRMLDDRKNDCVFRIFAAGLRAGLESGQDPLAMALAFVKAGYPLAASLMDEHAEQVRGRIPPTLSVVESDAKH